METYNVALIPLILGVVELFKKAGLPVKWCGLLSAFLGVMVGILYVAPENILQGILVGLSLGLAASGLYSTTKNTTEGIKE